MCAVQARVSLGSGRHEGASMTRIACVLTLILAVPAAASAQHEALAAGEQRGTVSVQSSCNPAVAAEFNRAVALLHSFEFRDALATFNAVLERDASCAIAYWGIALCQWGNPFAGVKAGPLLDRGRDAVEKGLATGKPTLRERGY